MKASFKKAEDLARDIVKRKIHPLDLALKHPAAALEALDLLDDNNFTHIARECITAGGAEGVGNLTEPRTRKFAAKALRAAAYASLSLSGQVPIEILSREFSLKV